MAKSPIIIALAIILLAGCDKPKASGGPTTAPSNTPTPAVSPKPVVAEADGEPAPGSVSTNKKDGAEIVYIPGGRFNMGSTPAEIDSVTAKQPGLKGLFSEQHTVSLEGYYIYKNLVTIAEYKAFCSATGTQMPPAPDFDSNWRDDDHPIVNVSWFDAQKYCAWAGASLPTAEQWEKAARGTDGRIFPWGNNWDASKLHCSKKAMADVSETTAVGKFTDSPYRLSDMAGNVWQWCAGSNLKYRPIRGCSFVYPIPEYFHASAESSFSPDHAESDLGFRCVVPRKNVAKPPENESTGRVPVTESIVPSEKYRALAEPGLLTVKIQATRMVQDAYGNTKAIGGKIDFVFVGDKQLELKTNEIVHDTEGDWVVTKSYGRIRVGGAGQGSGPWITASQEAQFRSLSQSK